VTARQPLSSGGGQARRARDAQGVPDQAKVDRLPRRCRGQRQPAHRRATAVDHIQTEASVPIPQAFSAPCASVSKHYSSVRGVHLIAECCTVPSAVRAVPALATGTYTARASRSCKYTGGGGKLAPNCAVGAYPVGVQGHSRDLNRLICWFPSRSKVALLVTACHGLRDPALLAPGRCAPCAERRNPPACQGGPALHWAASACSSCKGKPLKLKSCRHCCVPTPCAEL